MTTEKPIEQERAGFIEGLGLTYQASFQPTPQPNEKNPQLHWLITLSKGNQVMQVTYKEGMGHVKGYKQHYKTPYDRRQAELAMRKTCETGKLYRYDENSDWWMPFGTQPPPSLESVLWCLIMDADCLNYATYEEWADNLGYDRDSRKGEAMYRECIAQSLKLKQLIGMGTIEKLQELYQDY